MKKCISILGIAMAVTAISVCGSKSSPAKDEFQQTFASPAAAQSYEEQGNMSLNLTDGQIIECIKSGRVLPENFTRTFSCSTGCSVNCSRSCSTCCTHQCGRGY